MLSQQSVHLIDTFRGTNVQSKKQWHASGVAPQSRGFGEEKRRVDSAAGTMMSPPSCQQAATNQVRPISVQLAVDMEPRAPAATAGKMSVYAYSARMTIVLVSVWLLCSFSLYLMHVGIVILVDSDMKSLRQST